MNLSAIMSGTGINMLFLITIVAVGEWSPARSIRDYF